jgi:putative hydrolase of the HAD superfamily
MAIIAILFDLDDTLVVEEASAEAAFLATCERAREQYDVAPKVLYQAVRHHARQLWRASPTITSSGVRAMSCSLRWRLS